MEPVIIERKPGLPAIAGKFVGVVPPLSFQTLSMPKRLLLMFDQLALDLGASSMALIERRILQRASGEIRWLSSQGLLTTLGGLAASVAPPAGSHPTIAVAGGDLLEPVLGRRLDLMGRVGHLERLAAQGLRQTAADLRSHYGIDAVAVPESLSAEDSDAAVTRDRVIRIVLREFPSPSDSTPWEAIQDFRDDRDAVAKFARLKSWINRTGRSGLKEYEVADELRWLIHEYEENMRLHRMRAEKGILEIVITTTAEIAEGIIKVRWSEAARAIFDVKKQRLQLLTEEKDSIGREVAYIPAARRRFNHS